MDKSIDPREHMEHINFEAWAQELLSEDLLKVIWIYISREVKEMLVVVIHV